MKKTLSKILIAVLVLGASSLSTASSVNAGGSLYLSPSGASVASGSSISLYVRVNATSAVDAVQANLSYPADKLTFLSSYGGGAFEIQAENSGGNGSIRIGRGTLSAKSGDNLIATISFRAVPSSGSASIGFTAGSEAVKGGSVVASATSGATITFTEPAPAAKPKPKDKKVPKISDIQVKNVGLNTATVTWKTNEKASSIVEYGPSKKLGLVTSNSKLAKSHKVSLSKKLLLAGSKYYYQVRSKDKAGNVAKSKVTSFKTKGYSIKLKILDERGNPLEKVKVKLIPGLEETTTSETGVAIFTDVAAGKHFVNVTVGEQVLAAQIEVEESTDPETVQNIEVKIAGVAAKNAIDIPDAVYLGIIVVLVIFVAGLVWWGRKYYKPIKKS